MEHLLHRVTFRKKTIYCGYDPKAAAKEFFTVEPEATSEQPVEWKGYLVPDNPLVTIAVRTLQRTPADVGDS